MSKFRRSAMTCMALVALSLMPAKAAGGGLPVVKSVDFSLKLFRHEAAGNGKNVLLSPFSAYDALCMTANGASGSTLDQMAETLGASASTMADLNSRNHEVMVRLNSNKQVQMEIANAIYADTKTKFKPAFIKLCEQSYQAEAKNENFADPQTVQKINSWCDIKTHGKIKEIIQKLTPSEKMVLLNSVYFKGAWEHAFKVEDTQAKPFHLIGGTTKKVPLMSKTFRIGYIKSKNMQAVSIPYKGHEQMMYIFLPDAGADFSAFKEQFTPDNWSSWLSGFANKRVNLAIPKYKVEFKTELSASLKTMGMPSAFGDKADFSKMFADQRANISRVLQKTYMDVNEEGTEAAAVTAVVMATAAMRVDEPPIDFVVDRPFVVALVDQPTGEILFMGSIVDP